MIPYIQTKTAQFDEAGKRTQIGNCVSTCVASLLDLPIEDVPDSSDMILFDQSQEKWLNVFLFKHYGLEKQLVFDWEFMNVMVPTSWHIINGETIRTAKTGIHHAVVGYKGEMIHDPHPAQTGLTVVHSYGIIGEPPKRLMESRRKFYDELKCVCPKCGGFKNLNNFEEKLEKAKEEFGDNVDWSKYE